MDSLAALEVIPNQDWKVRVRVSRSWRQFISEGEVIGVRLIVVDENGKRMHAWIRSGLINALEQEIVEGRIIDIQNFVVRPYSNSHVNKGFYDDKIICLTSITIILAIEEPVPNFPMHAFCCTPINNIINMHRNNHLIDVVGFVISVQPIRTFIHRDGREHSFLKFVLANNEEATVSVTFWDELVDDFWQNFQGIVKQPVNALISSCKVLTHRGIPTLTTVHATRFFLNPMLSVPNTLLNGDEEFVML